MEKEVAERQELLREHGQEVEKSTEKRGSSKVASNSAERPLPGLLLNVLSTFSGLLGLEKALIEVQNS
jgi:hypothetical protein